jgi:protein-S-isoprenylcysteine O-methyltransferase Ste14
MRSGVLGCYVGRSAGKRAQSLAEPLPRLLAFPPFLYLAAFALGWLLHQLAPFQAMPVAVARGGGALLAAASISLLAWSRITLHRAGTTSLPGRPSVALRLAGPYRWTRNPMCLGMAGLYLCLGFLLNAVAPLVLFLPVFAVMDRRVIRWEERNLAALRSFLGQAPSFRTVFQFQLVPL